MQQTIEASTFNGELAIKTYDLPLLAQHQINQLVGFFQTEFPRFSVGFLKIYITAIRIDPAEERFIIYMLTTRLSENVVSCNIHFFGNEHFDNLKYILVNFIRELKEGLDKIEDASDDSLTAESIPENENGLIEIPVEESETLISPLPEKFDVDQLLREFTEEEKKKKLSARKPPKMKGPTPKKRKKSPPNNK